MPSVCTPCVLVVLGALKPDVFFVVPFPHNATDYCRHRLQANHFCGALPPSTLGCSLVEASKKIWGIVALVVGGVVIFQAQGLDKFHSKGFFLVMLASMFGGLRWVLTQVSFPSLPSFPSLSRLVQASILPAKLDAVLCEADNCALLIFTRVCPCDRGLFCTRRPDFRHRHAPTPMSYFRWGSLSYGCHMLRNMICFASRHCLSTSYVYIRSSRSDSFAPRVRKHQRVFWDGRYVVSRSTLYGFEPASVSIASRGSGTCLIRPALWGCKPPHRDEHILEYVCSDSCPSVTFS